MEALLEEQEKLSRKGNLSKSLEDVQKTIDLLVKARDSIAASTFSSLPWVIRLKSLKHAHCYSQDQNSASVTLAKLQNPVKQSFEAINSDLKDVYKGLGNYSKALDKVWSTFLYSFIKHKLNLVLIEIQRQALANHRLRRSVLTSSTDQSGHCDAPLEGGPILGCFNLSDRCYQESSALRASIWYSKLVHKI